MTDTTTSRAAAEGLVARYCGWHIGDSQTETFVVDGSGANIQMLPTLHMTAVQSVYSDGVLLDPLSYDWSAFGFLQLPPGYVWSYRLRGVTATVTHGYEFFPDEVDTLIDRLADRIADDPGYLAQVGEVRYSISGGITTAGLLTKTDKATLAPFRIPR